MSIRMIVMTISRPYIRIICITEYSNFL